MNNRKETVADAAFEGQRFFVNRLFISEREQRKIGGHPVLAPNADALSHSEKTDAQTGFGKQRIRLAAGFRFYLQAGKPHFLAVENKAVPELSAGQRLQIPARESIAEPATNRPEPAPDAADASVKTAKTLKE